MPSIPNPHHQDSITIDRATRRGQSATKTKQKKQHSARSSHLLPPELWAQVLEQLSPTDLQHTALALSIALPNAGVTLQHLFTAVKITRDLQASQLIRRLGPRYEDAQQARNTALSFNGQAWRTDSNVLVNLITILPRLQTINLNVGPLFAPEHLEELVEFERPHTLQSLSLRFNPYVDRASYTIFLKGLYFDSGILRLAKWPSTPSFNRLSLVQDPIPSFGDLTMAAKEAGSEGPRQAHAQPIVFFKLSCLSTLATSPVSAHLTHVRLRIPNRSLLTALSTGSTSSTVIPATHSATLPKPLPALEYLDLSTTYVSCDGAFQGLLKRHPSLTHLVVDRTGLIRTGMAEGDCEEIGKVVGSIGVARANEATKVWKAVLRAQQARVEQRRQEILNQMQRREIELQRQAQIQGRQLGSMPTSTATTAMLANAHLNDVVEQETTRASRRGRSSYATESRRVRNANAAAATATGSSNSSAANGSSGDGLADALSSMSLSSATAYKPIILPSPPSLLSLACGVSSTPPPISTPLSSYASSLATASLLASALASTSASTSTSASSSGIATPDPSATSQTPLTIDSATRASWSVDFQRGYTAGLERCVSLVEDRMEDYKKAWNRASNATHRTAVEDRVFPRYYRFLTPDERKEKRRGRSTTSVQNGSKGVYVGNGGSAAGSTAVEGQPSKNEEEETPDILSTLELVPTDSTYAHSLIAILRTESSCSLCTIPDCAAEGRIAWTENSREQEERERAKWRRGRGEHVQRCAHLIGREVWENDGGEEV